MQKPPSDGAKRSIILRRLTGVIAASLLLCVATSAAAIPAASFSTTGRSIGAGTGTFGWDFTVTKPIVVQQLGVFDGMQMSGGVADGDGIMEEHVVRLWESDETLLASATVSAGASGAELFRYASLDTEITLVPGTTYVIGADYTSLLDQMRSNNSFDNEFVFDSRVVPGLRRFQSFTVGFPGTASTDHHAFGPSFTFVPEPSTALLFASGVLGLAARRRGRPRGLASATSATGIRAA